MVVSGGGLLQVWLQEFAWTEKDVPRKRQERASSLPQDSTELLRMNSEPMYCFEVGGRQTVPRAGARAGQATAGQSGPSSIWVQLRARSEGLVAIAHLPAGRKAGAAATHATLGSS